MSAMTTFDSPKLFLLELLRGIGDGKIQLPDFQRGWVWDDQHIRDLLASISLSYPIGAVMMLQTGNPNVRFGPRFVEGVDLRPAPEPERLILDGQQRLTSLYQALIRRQPVVTRDARGSTIRRFYYIDIRKALDPNVDREDAIRALGEDRLVKNFRGEVIEDYSTREKEFKAGLFPATEVFDCATWRAAHNEAWDYDREKVKLFDAFDREIIERFKQYQVPVILLAKETPKDAVCQVFEKVNQGGVALTVFELLTATYAADNFKLRDDWAKRERRFKHYRLLADLKNTDFLQAVTLLATHARRTTAMEAGTSPDNLPGISCKRKDILRLSLRDYQAQADAATEGFERAAKLLFSQKLFAARDLPYQTQLTPLAAILAILGEHAENDGVRNQIIRWYWCGVLGELYGGAIETRFAKDLADVLAWIDGAAEPTTVTDANFVPNRLLTLRTRNSAAYKGISALLMRDGGLDFRTGVSIDQQLYFDEQLDIHHIFPKAYCNSLKVDRGRRDCIVNKTPLSAKTNRMIGGNAPSVYLAKLEKNASIRSDRMNEILISHIASPEAMRADDFEAFFATRQEDLLQRIENALGKRISRSAPGIEAADALQPEDEEEVEEAIT